MNEARRKLSTDEVREAAPGEWRQIGNRIKARYRTGDFRTGLALVDRIGALAEEADHHPSVHLGYSEVIVSLVTHDTGGITPTDLDLARRISEQATGLGVTADPSGLTQVELGLDTPDGTRLTPFYAALLGSREVDGEPVDPTDQVPTVWWQEPDDQYSGDQGPGDDLALPDQPFEQRWHLDVWVAHDEAQRRLQAVLDAGGRLVSDRAAPAYWVVEDAEGNRSCICSPTGR